MSVARPLARRTSYKSFGACGAAMLEFAVVLPLFLLLLAGIVDFGKGLEQYFVLRRLAYESGRMASNTEKLELGTYSPDTGVEASMHSTLHGKMRTMIDFHGDQRFPEHVWVETERKASDPRIVRVSLRTTIKPFFINFIPPMSVTATVDAPYLFTE